MDELEKYYEKNIKVIDNHFINDEDGVKRLIIYDEILVTRFSIDYVSKQLNTPVETITQYLNELIAFLRDIERNGLNEC